MKYYLDSSENSSPDPDHAIDTYATIGQAQAAAIAAAKAQPGTEFYVNEVVTTYRVVYRAQATIDVKTEVLDAPAE